MNYERSAKPIPFIRCRGPDDIVAYRDGNSVTAVQFLADVRLLAEKMPPRTHVLNFCADRYHFAVGFAAALLRRQITLLPPNATPELMRQLTQQYPGLYCLTSDTIADAVLDQVVFPREPGGVSGDFTIPAFDYERIAAVIFTSGSTGSPVQHLKRWGVLVQSTLLAGMRLGAARLRGGAVLATVSPQHSYGLESSVMLPLQNRLVLTASQGFYPADIIRELDALPRPRILVTTPIHLRFLCADPAPVPEVDLLVSATAPLSTQRALNAEARFRCPLIEIYGSAEVGQTAFRRTAENSEWTCIDGVNLSQDGQGTWASGELLDGKVLLNDIIELHGPDRFVLRGRTADLVNIAGKRTSLANLNFHLNTIDGVIDGVFVIPERDTESLRLAAFVVAPSLSADSLRQELRKRIDPVFLPRPLCFVETLPRNATGKLTRKEVERLLTEAGTAQNLPDHAVIVFPADTESVIGHFPGDPIIPGAVLLQEVLCTLQAGLENCTDGWQLTSVKFLRPVRPHDRMEIRWALTDTGDTRFDCSVQAQTVLTGVIANLAAAT